MFTTALLMVIFVAGSAAQSCGESSYGTEFIFGFVNLKSYSSFLIPESPDLLLQSMSDGYSSLEIGIPERSSTSKSPKMEIRHVSSYGYKETTFNSSFINTKGNTSIGGAIMVTSTRKPVSLVAKYSVGPYVVSSPIYPVNVLGQLYIVPSFPPNSLSQSNAEIMVIALNDSTHINIKGYAMSSPVYSTLNRLETYIYSANKDLSSVIVRSDHPVAVFSSYNMGLPRSYNSYNNYMYHQPMTVQLLPSDDSAVHFVVPAITMSRDLNYYLVRIFAAEGGAHIKIYTSSTNVQNVHVYSGIYYEMQTRSYNSLEIISDSPVQVFQIPQESSYSPGLFMVQVPAISQYLTSYLSISAGDQSSYIVVIPEEEATGLLIDNKPVVHNVDSVATTAPLGKFKVMTIDGHAYSHVSHVGNINFGLFVYGKQDTDLLSYGYPAGINFNSSGCLNNHATDPAFIG